MRRLYYCIFLVIVVYLFACDGEALLTSLTTDDLSLKYMATFASNNPRPWWDGQTVTPDQLVDDSVVHTVPEEMPSFILPDIAEVRLNGDHFAIKRKYVQAEISDDEPIFSGTGIYLECNDLADNKMYDTLDIYFRKLVYGNGWSYTSAWEFDEKLTTQFGNDDLDGFDTIQLLKYSQEDVNNDDESNLVFPLMFKVFDRYKHKRHNKYVIEFRVVLKNNIKYYEYSDSDDGDYYGYYGPGDSIVNVTEGDSYIGGNLRGAVYIYDPEQTVTITGSAPAGTYVVAIEETDVIEDYIGTRYIPPRATWCSDGTYELTNVMTDKTYKLYYSSNSPSAVHAETVTGYTGETLVEIGTEQAGESITVNF